MNGRVNGRTDGPTNEGTNERMVGWTHRPVTQGLKQTNKQTRVKRLKHQFSVSYCGVNLVINFRTVSLLLLTFKYSRRINKTNDSPFVITGGLDNLLYLDRPQPTAQITPRHLARPVPCRAYHPDQIVCLRYLGK